MTLNSGDVLVNRYRIVKLVGQGGFGAVYRAWDTSLGVPVAVKENLDTSAEAQHQFEQEARLLAPLRHDNLPRVSDHFFISGQGQYLVMDFVEGKSLEALLAERGGPLPEAEALRWIAQVCNALDYLHTRTPPIIHRDIKPQNIIVTADGRAVLVDFGISKAYDPTLKTTRGARAVTAGFSPPEQYGMGTTDARSDVYALGATLYMLLTGAPPPESVALIAGGETLTPIRQANPGVSLTTEAAVAAAMTLATSQRLRGAGELRDALAGRAIAPLPQVARTVALPAAGERRGAPAWLLAVVGLVAVVILAGVAYRLWANRGDDTPAEPTTVAVDEATAVAGLATTQTADAAADVAATPPPLLAQVVVATATAEPTATATPAPTETPAVTATPANRRVIVQPEGGDIQQVLVPAGSFLMGADDVDSDTDEAPIHEVRLDAFWIDQFEVTNEQFAGFVAATGYVTTDELDGVGDTVLTGGFERVSGANWQHPQGPGSDLAGRADEPVTLVSWDDARAYCAWAGGRLPTEAEWEYAARGPDAHTFPWGDGFDATRLNYCDRNCFLEWADGQGDDGFVLTAPVSSFPDGASWMGAVDMAGNVWEWTADWYDPEYYDIAPSSDPRGPGSGVQRVVRGGGWDDTFDFARSANRHVYAPDRPQNYLGFRCAYD